MSDLEHLSESSDYSCSGGSSGNEADSENEQHFEIREITEMMNEFRPYIFEPEKEVSSTSYLTKMNPRTMTVERLMMKHFE